MFLAVAAGGLRLYQQKQASDERKLMEQHAQIAMIAHASEPGRVEKVRISNTKLQLQPAYVSGIATNTFEFELIKSYKIELKISTCLPAETTEKASEKGPSATHPNCLVVAESVVDVENANIPAKQARAFKEHVSLPQLPNLKAGNWEWTYYVREVYTTQ